MKNHFIKLSTLLLLSVSIFSCKKDYGGNLGPLQDSVADIPVTVTNADAFERFPVIYTSVAAGGTFSINFSIPSDKGKIKQITKVATSSSVQSLSYTNLNAVAASTAYNTAPIPGNGSNTITFSSKLSDYLTYRVRVGTSAGPIGPSVGPPTVPGGPPTGPPTIPVPSITTAPTDIAFYFRFDLEDGTSIVSLPVRVRVQP